MNRKQKRQLQKKINSIKESSVEHIQLRLKERYKESFSENQIKYIQQQIKNCAKGNRAETMEFSNVKKLKKSKLGTHYLVCFKHKFYRFVYDSNVNCVVTTLPLYENLDNIKTTNISTYEKTIEANNKVKEVIDNYYKNTIIKLSAEDYEVIGFITNYDFNSSILLKNFSIKQCKKKIQ